VINPIDHLIPLTQIGQAQRLVNTKEPHKQRVISVFLQMEGKIRTLFSTKVNTFIHSGKVGEMER